jgi:hypothetical protein
MNKLVTYQKIMEFKPCYNPQEIGMPIDYEDTGLNFIEEYRHKVKDLKDIYWVIRKLDLFTLEQYQWFALGSAKMIQHLIKDESSIKALEVTEAYLNGNATKEELEMAKNGAHAAACVANAAYNAVDAAVSADAAYYAVNVAVSAALDKLEIQNKQIDLMIDILKKDIK